MDARNRSRPLSLDKGRQPGSHGSRRALGGIGWNKPQVIGVLFPVVPRLPVASASPRFLQTAC